MAKKISVEQLKPGMYVADLGAAWMDHPFLRNQFPVRDEATIRKIADAGIREVYIDPAQGLDVADAPTDHEVRKEIEAEMLRVAAAPAAVRRVGTREELGRAKVVHGEANRIIHNIMNDVRLGRQVQLEAVEPVVEKMTESILRNSGALLSLCRVKNKDDYTFQHSVSVCALLVAFCRAAGLDDETIRLAGIGGLLHDIGKVHVPINLLNKPARYTDEEFERMKRHVVESKKILDQTEGIHEISAQVAFEHHERYDGSGYSQGLAGERISQMGRMAAICDVYDAITSDRVYHKGLAPHEALRKIFEWSKFHFDPRLVHQFMRATGIYPVGTMVMLESGRIGVVLEQSEISLLRPLVRVFYDSRQMQYITPQEVDLAKPEGHGGADKILGHETPEKWGIKVEQFI
ncbi:MAG TPA: HD-GYP domain-containing protein [Rhodocyclaceae bacterium]